MEFSKKSTMFILGFCSIVFIGVFAEYIFHGKNTKELLDYLQPVIMTILISYYGKAAVENVTKVVTSASIKNKDTDGSI